MHSKKKAWAVMAAVMLASVVIAANRFRVPPVLPVLMEDLQADMVMGGWLSSVSSLASIILAIPVALVLSRLGLRATGAIALGCAFAGSIVGALAANATAMLVGRIIEGVSLILIAVVAPTAISQWFEPRERGLPMGIWAAWIPIGSVLTFNIAHPMQTAFGWRSLWWLGGLLSLGCLVIYILVVTDPPGADAEGNEPSASFGRMLFSPNIWLLGLAFAAFSFCILAYNTWAPAYLTYALSLPPALAGSYASLMFLAAIPANIIAGWLINRLPDRYILLPITFVATSIILFWSFRLGSVSVIVPYMIVLGFVSNFVPTTVFTLAPETMPRLSYASLALALAIGFANIGSLIGPPAVGRVASQGTWATASVLLVVVMAVGTVLAWLSSKRLRAKWHSTSISNP